MAGTISIKNKELTFSFSYNADLVYDIKSRIQGRRWNPNNKEWHAPYSEENLDICRFLLDEYTDFGLEFSSSFEADLAAMAEAEKTALAASQAVDANIEIEGLNGELRDFQKAGIAYALNKKRTFIADEQGLGKTIQALAAIHHKQALPAIIVTPSIVKLNWKNEIEKWVPNAKVHVAGVGKRASGVSIETADFVVINYEIVKKHLSTLNALHAKAVVCDESQYLKNGKAARTKAVEAMIQAANPDLVLMLTGTPIMNRPVELASPLKIMGLLNSEFGGWRNFVVRFCAGEIDGRGHWDVNGASNLEELNIQLRATCMIRRNKKTVLKELPAKIYSEISVSLSRECGFVGELKKFTSWLDSQLKELGKSTTKKTSVAKKIQTLMKAGNSNSVLAEMTNLRRCTGLGKVPAIVNWIKDFSETEEALVVFAYHKDVQRALQEAFPEALAITGGLSAEARQGAVDTFQAGKSKLIICSLKAAQTGITLTAASNVLMAELDWAPSALSQAEDRCHRIGQKGSVSVYKVIAEDGFDSTMLEILSSKINVIDAAINHVAKDADQAPIQAPIQASTQPDVEATKNLGGRPRLNISHEAKAERRREQNRVYSELRKTKRREYDKNRAGI